ncbi:MAG: Ig-like domain-containing protein, partial [Candidatus Syntrophosphaera sp.]
PTNVSFNAGAGYLYEETSASSSSHTFTFDTLVSETFGADIGLVVNGVGVEGGYSFESALTIGSSTTDTYTTETSISYELADDDETSYLNFQPDYFTVDIKKDPVYGTPVFDLLAGASSNRWEQNTMPRDGVSFSANTYTASGLQEGDTAAFLLNLGNTSQTGEHRRYFLTLRHETNPGGAVVNINGLPLTDRMAFNVPPGEQVQAVMTVDQGAGGYECEGLTLEFFAEGDRGHDGPDGHDFWVTRPFNIYWEPPYSRVEILQPEEGWILNQACGNQMEVLLAGYDAEIPDLISLLLQYKHPADTDWLPALEIPRDSLLAHPQYITALWDVSALSDGSYQIRACASHALQGDHYSPALLGMIDRASPEIWGMPQPADGILEPGDLISASFTEAIDPNSLQAGDVSLTVLRTGMAVDVDAQVSGSELSIVPAVANYWLENETLRVTLSNLGDMHGNPLAEPVMWEFFVNANPVYWTQPKIEVIKALGEPLEVSAQLHNSGGQYSSFSLTGLPQWLTASPNSGDLLPLETQIITFNISQQLGYGVFRDTIYADIPGLGREPLVFEVSVLSDPPAWASTPLGDFAYSMNITGQLFLEGALSTNTDDVIGAFCWDEAVSGFCLRGAASLVSLPLGEGCYEFFLTVYSDTETGVPLHFRVWDSSENKEHFGIEEEFVFSSEAIYGTPLEPIVIHPKPELYFARPCSSGWNWLS